MAGAPTPAAKYLFRERDPLAVEFYRRLAEGQLLTTHCRACARTSFPPLARCPDCGRVSDWVELPRQGRLYAFTTQETALRFTAPLVLGLVDVGEVTLPAISPTPYDQLRIGQAVRLEAFEEPDTGLTLLSFTGSS